MPSCQLMSETRHGSSRGSRPEHVYTRSTGGVCLDDRKTEKRVQFHVGGCTRVLTWLVC